MPISHELAHALAEQLTTIPDCPRSEGALDALADDLAKFCADAKEARWLVAEARARWEEWHGSARLLEILINEQNKNNPLPNQWVDYGPAPATHCKACEDWGHLDDPKSKLRVWCKCEMGVWQAQRHPGLVEALNGFKARSEKFSKSVTKTERRSTPDWLKTFTEGYK